MSEKIRSSGEVKKQEPPIIDYSVLEQMSGKQGGESSDTAAETIRGRDNDVTVAENKQEAISQAREDVAAAIKEKQASNPGPKVLARVGFEGRHKEIVESSFNKARRRGDKLPGKNAERRDLAYLSRLEAMIERGDRRMEKRLWRMSAENLIADGMDDAILENGRSVADVQRESLREWVDYFSSEETPFPLWFRVYAWDGMSTMGVYDRERKEYVKRDSETIAPYPGLNQGALAKTYELICSQYAEEGEKPDSVKLEQLAKNCNFAAIYTHFMLERKKIIPTPERTEDVRGEWIEYVLGEEKKLSVAAEGTPWCIASPTVGKQYLEGGRYGAKKSHKNSKARFVLFHLENPEIGQLSESACASIRLGINGKVEEISGLKSGQALDDALVPIVEAKCETLPGGKKFMNAFRDKNELIRLDNKIKAGEELSREELEFVYEVNRPIHKLDTYNEMDSKLGAIREKYDAKKALEMGLPVGKICNAMSDEEKLDNLEILMKAGINGKKIIGGIEDVGLLLRNKEKLAQNGIRINWKKMIKESYLGVGDVAESFDVLMGLGVDIDILAQGVWGEKAMDNLQKLLKKGYTIHEVLKHAFKGLAEEGHLEELVKLGATKEEIADDLTFSGLNEEGAREVVDWLMQNGMNMSDVVANMNRLGVRNGMDKLLSMGANPNQLGKGITELSDLEKLLSAGADINAVLSNCGKKDVLFYNMEDLIKRGANPELFVGAAALYCSTWEELKNAVTLGVSLDGIIGNMSEYNIDILFDELMDEGVAPEKIAARMSKSAFRKKMGAYRFKKAFGLKMDYQKEED